MAYQKMNSVESRKKQKKNRKNILIFSGSGSVVELDLKSSAFLKNVVSGPWYYVA